MTKRMEGDREDDKEDVKMTAKITKEGGQDEKEYSK